MTGRGSRWALVAFLLISIVLAIAVIPAIGIETRNLTTFPSWQQNLFMYGGPLFILLSLLAAATVVGWPKFGAALSVLSALLSLAMSGVGIAVLGAPPAPSALIDLDGLHLIVSLIVIVLAAVVWAGATAPRPPPQPVGPMNPPAISKTP